MSFMQKRVNKQLREMTDMSFIIESTTDDSIPEEIEEEIVNGEEGDIDSDAVVTKEDLIIVRDNDPEYDEEDWDDIDDYPSDTEDDNDDDYESDDDDIDENNM